MKYQYISMQKTKISTYLIMLILKFRSIRTRLTLLALRNGLVIVERTAQLFGCHWIIIESNYPEIFILHIKNK